MLVYPFSHVVAHVAHYTNVTQDAILAGSKLREVVCARSYCFHILRFAYDRSWREIANAFQMNESAVRNSCQSLENRARQFPVYRKDIDLLCAYFTIYV